MKENPYRASASLPSPPATERKPLNIIELASGLLIVIGLLLAVARSLWLADWLLCVSIAIVICGLLGGAVVARRRSLPKS